MPVEIRTYSRVIRVMESNIIRVKAKDIQVGDQIEVSIMNYHGWETVTRVTATERDVEIATVDYAHYNPEHVFQVKRS
jgi:hypothetical protein